MRTVSVSSSSDLLLQPVTRVQGKEGTIGPNCLGLYYTHAAAFGGDYQYNYSSSLVNFTIQPPDWQTAAINELAGQRLIINSFLSVPQKVLSLFTTLHRPCHTATNGSNYRRDRIVARLTGDESM